MAKMDAGASDIVLAALSNFTHFDRRGVDVDSNRTMNTTRVSLLVSTWMTDIVQALSIYVKSYSAGQD